jgi:hypothetical protein
MIAEALGEEIEYETAGPYDVAGVLMYPDAESGFPRKIVAVGTSYASVTSRTRTVARKARPGMHKGDEHYVMQVVGLVEATAPVVRDYFGTHNVVIDALYKPGTEAGLMMTRGWAYPQDIDLTGQRRSLKAGRTMIRRLAKEGYTAIAFRQGSRIADFQMDELLKSMNTRKKA